MASLNKGAGATAASASVLPAARMARIAISCRGIASSESMRLVRLRNESSVGRRLEPALRNQPRVFGARPGRCFTRLGVDAERGHRHLDKGIPRQRVVGPEGAVGVAVAVARVCGCLYELFGPVAMDVGQRRGGRSCGDDDEQ